MWYSENWKDYELLDATDGERLERWGKYILVRPDPQIIWRGEAKHPLWKKADAIYRRSSAGGGGWKQNRLPEQWNVTYGDLKFLIKPMGFTIDDRKLKRAGLDYWDKLDITYYENYEDFLTKHPDAKENTYFFTTKAPKAYTDVDSYPDNVYIMFGKETKGLPEDLLYENRDYCVRIPMRDTLRSLNLSNSVAIAVYEILRRWDFEGLREDGQLTSRDW